MTVAEVLAILKDAPLIASVQAPEGPVDDARVLEALARASMQEGVGVVRLGHTLMGQDLGIPAIGLIKKHYPDSEVYITPTSRELAELLKSPCKLIGLDGTGRPRPGGETFAELVQMAHSAGRLVMADCDTPESAALAIRQGADFIGSTLAGYTENRAMTDGPDFDALRGMLRAAPGRVIAEGRYAEPWQAQAAMAMGAIAVTIGGALNDPHKQTERFLSAMRTAPGPIGAVDIGGTWIRFATYDGGHLGPIIREPLPQNKLAWIKARLAESGVTRLGISTGGTVHKNGVTEASDLIPDYVGTKLEFPGVGVLALNDGLATAWGHACHPDFAGLRVATLAMGTGLGFGIVDRGRLLMGPSGEAPKLNHRAFSGGGTLEGALGGAFAGKGQAEVFLSAAQEAVRFIQELYYPDVIVRCGGVGLAADIPGTVPSPYGENAGLMGAALVAKVPVLG